MSHRQLRLSRSVLPYLAVVLLAFLAAQPLAAQLPQGHDTLLHFYRIPLMNAQLRQGVLFSRWSPDLMLGYGYPLLNFYPPLSVYGLTAAAWLAGGNAPTAMGLALGLTLLVAAVGMFALARELYGEAAGLLASAAYVLSPTILYHVFERGSLSNAMAMALFPLAALGLVRAVRIPQLRRLGWAAVLFGAVLLSHTAASLAFAAPLAALGLVASLAAGRPRVRQRVVALAAALAGGLALAAFVWLPALAEVRFTQYTDAISAPDLHYSHFFADVVRWPEPAIDELNNPPLPVSAGLGQLILAIASCGLALHRLATRRGSQEDKLTAAAGLLGLGAVFLATPLSSPLWEHIGLLRYFQFPFRWLDPGAFLLALACGGLVRQLRVKWQVSILCGALLTFFANAVPYLYPPRWHSLPARPSLADVGRAEVTWGIYGLTSWGEYAPATARLRPTVPPASDANGSASLAQKLLTQTLPQGALLSATGTPWRADIRIRVPAATSLVFETFYFPGWAAQIDNVSAPLGPDTEGRLTLAVPAGEHTVSVHFGSTPVRAIADGLSALAAAMVLSALLWPRPQRRLPEMEAVPRLVTTPVAAFAGLLIVLVIAKVGWLDRLDTPLVRHVRNGALAGTVAPESRNFGGELWLAGYHLDTPSQLVLYWQALRTPAHDYTIELTLTDARGLLVGVIRHTHPGLGLTSRWEPGQLVRDLYSLPLATAPRPGVYHLTVRVLQPEADVPLSLLDAPAPTLTATAVGIVKLPPPVGPLTGNMSVRFGEAIELQQVEIPTEARTGAPLAFTLVWKCLAPVGINYTVYVHLLRPDGTLAATADGPPCDGRYPASSWSPGERIVDERQWLVAVPPGDYQVACGLYQLQTGERLPAVGANVEPAQGVNLGVLRVAP